VSVTTLLRAVSRLPGIASDLADWYTEMRQIAEHARRQRIEDEGRDPRDRHDLARWVREPDRRRPRPQGGNHDA
jgi:Sec-independent protein translocase protein TatA